MCHEIQDLVRYFYSCKKFTGKSVAFWRKVAYCSVFGGGKPRGSRGKSSSNKSVGVVVGGVVSLELEEFDGIALG